ncbi:hypothetical protein FSP39_006954 [Pinctada imbricata]|uniref:Glutathione peroxidase n=1 Tax=Pinctada imbricata TaxID=66713 RepID=A0AA88YUJ0_PINIB|nr:hypothetical protein FSP39_006954 [Pinctada imbricata]
MAGRTLLLASVLGAFLSPGVGSVGVGMCNVPSTETRTLYDFHLRNVHKNETIPFSQYKGKVQEPGANGTEILNGVKHVRPGSGFIPAFPLTEKIDVNGAKEHKLYTFLKSHCDPVDERIFYPGIQYSQINIRDIRWNFEKFLINRSGLPVKRYEVFVEPADIHADIMVEVKKQVHHPDALG